nr:hypothetical protein [Kofleriaceae bacterium]
MTTTDLEARLGMPLGRTLTAVVELAKTLRPRAPWDSFAPLWFRMPWLRRGHTAAALRHSTPANVHPFAESGGDLVHFGFLRDDDRAPTDNLPIVVVRPKEDDEHTEIVAPDLRAFLGLLAIADGDTIARDLSDAEWAAARTAMCGDDRARRAEMDRLGDLLCGLPGVARPKRPSRVARACPAQRFQLDDGPRSDPQAVARHAAVAAARDIVLSLADGMADGRMLDRDELADAKATATRALVDSLASADNAAETVGRWHAAPLLWSALSRGVAGDLESLLARWISR